MKGNRKAETRKLTVSSLLAALGVVILYVGAVTDLFSLTAVAAVSLIEAFAVEEAGSPYKYGVYFVTGIISVLILPDKFTAFAYIAFGGIYPIIRPYFDRLGKPVAILLKLVFFNAVLSGLIALSLFVLSIEDDSVGFNVISYGLGNIAFIAYEYTFAVFLELYRRSLRKRMRIDRIFDNGKEKDQGRK